MVLLKIVLLFQGEEVVLFLVLNTCIGVDLAEVRLVDGLLIDGTLIEDLSVLGQLFFKHLIKFVLFGV